MRNLYLLDKHYPLNSDQISFYRNNGFIKLKNIFDAETLRFFEQSISLRVDQKSKDSITLQKRDTYGKAFLQIFNLWTEDEEIKRFVFSKRLAGIATELMEVEGVRMYHDQALYKEGNGGFTPWHADQYYWPLSGDKTITAWIHLQKIDPEMWPLEFSAGSQVIIEGRALAISEESEKQIESIVVWLDIGYTMVLDDWHYASRQETAHAWTRSLAKNGEVGNKCKAST